MVDILLSGSCFHDSESDQRASVYPPLGLLYVAAYLRRSVEVGVFDATFAHDESDFERALAQSKPRVVGFQTTITNRTKVRQLIRIAKATNSSVIAGGPDASASYADYLRWGADFVVIGEGEQTTLELVEHLTGKTTRQLGDIQGLAYQNGLQFVLTPPRSLISDLDALPWPARDLIDIGRYLDEWKRMNGYTCLHLLTSRGCPFSCTWCSHSVFGHSFRQRSVESVVLEMKALVDCYHPDSLWFADDTFTLNRNWVADWSARVLELGVAVPFRCFTRANALEPGTIQHLKAAGCRLVHIGVESGSQRILDAMQKQVTVDEIRRASALAKSAGLQRDFFLMFAYPGEQLEDIRATERLVEELRPDGVGFALAYPVPGTPFYKSVEHRLVPNIDAVWQKTTHKLQLAFQAEYPLIYYRLLVRDIELRLSHKHEKGVRKWITWIAIAAIEAARSIIAHAWPYVSPSIHAGSHERANVDHAESQDPVY